VVVDEKMIGKQENRDVEMEVLCCIPPYPGYCLVETLRVDFPLSRKEVFQVVRRLRVLYGVIDEGAGKRRRLSIPPKSWPMLTARCERYVRRVWT